GTIVCDLERRRPVTLLPDRERETSRAWLAAHPWISIVARDRGGGYGEAVTKALPHAEQVADRWHLMENASRAFLDAVSKSMRQIRKAVGSTIIDPKLLTYAERLQYEGYLRRQETNELFWNWRSRVCPSSRSSSVPVIAVSSSAAFCAASVLTCSAFDRVHWMHSDNL